MPTDIDIPSFEDRLASVRDTIGIGLSPVDRARQSMTLLSPKLGATPPPAAPGNGTNASNRTNGMPSAADANARLVANPAAYNYGRLAAPRSDLPAMVTADDARAAAGRGVSPAAGVPGIDVNSYVGSRYAQPGATAAQPAAMRDASGQPMGAAPTVLPVGNPTARDAMLRTEFPHASGRDLTALGNYAFNRPDAFNASMGGTRLDPINADLKQAQLAQEQARATHANTLSLDASDARARTATNDSATQDFFSGDAENAALAAAAKHGASATTLVDLARLAQERSGRAAALKQQGDERAQIEKDKTPYETDFGGRKAVVHNGNVTFEEPADKGMYPEPKIVTNEHGKFMQSGANQPWSQVKDDSKPMSINEWLLTGKSPDDYGKYRDDFKKANTATMGTGKPVAGAAAPAADAAPASAYKSAEDVRAAVHSGALKRDEGVGILQKQFGYK